MSTSWPRAGTYRRLGYVIPAAFADEDEVNLTYWVFRGNELVKPEPKSPVVPAPPRLPPRLTFIRGGKA